MNSRIILIFKVLIIGWIFSAAISECLAQLAPPDITVTPKPVGSGARALGQSAFISVAGRCYGGQLESRRSDSTGKTGAFGGGGMAEQYG